MCNFVFHRSQSIAEMNSVASQKIGDRDTKKMMQLGKVSCRTEEKNKLPIN